MINASLNLASFAGLLFIAWSVYGAIHIARQAKHLSNPTDYYFLCAGRLAFSVLAGATWFAHGWRLDPTLQWGVVFLTTSCCAESLVVNRNLKQR